MSADDISTHYVTDRRLGVAYPARAVIWVDGTYCFEASEPADWRAVLTRVGMTGGVIAIPEGATPGDAWSEADLRLARLVRCSCGTNLLDPDSEAYTVLLCEPCHEQTGWENTHSDGAHEQRPTRPAPSARRSTPLPDDPGLAGDGRLTVTFADDAHECFEDFVIERASAGYYARLDGTAVLFYGYQAGHLTYRHVDDHNEPVGDPQRLALRDRHGLLTVTHVEIL